LPVFEGRMVEAFDYRAKAYVSGRGRSAVWKELRHRTANVNEYSARYSILDKEFYLPTPDQLAAQSVVNRQGRGATLSAEESARVLRLLKQDADTAYTHYMEMLNLNEQGQKLADDQTGIARELARMNLSLNFYTQWYWKCDLHNFMNFLKLRADSHAQFEIRVYAEKLLEILKIWCPMAYDAFLEHRLHATVLSKSAVSVLQKALKREPVSQETSGLTKREWGELTRVFPITQDKP
jgi:thymidylate synthase (FAD)